MEIMGLQVSNTNGNSKQQDRVRVYRDGEVIAEVYPTSRNPLGYVRKHPASKYTVSLIEQLRACDVDDATIFAICGTV